MVALTGTYCRLPSPLSPVTKQFPAKHTPALGIVLAASKLVSRTVWDKLRGGRRLHKQAQIFWLRQINRTIQLVLELVQSSV